MKKTRSKMFKIDPSLFQKLWARPSAHQKKLAQSKFVQMLFIPLNKKKEYRSFKHLLSHAIFVSESLTYKFKNQVQSCDFSRYLEIYINPPVRLYGLLKPNQIYSPSKTLSSLKKAMGTFKTLCRRPSIIIIDFLKLYHKHNSKKFTCDCGSAQIEPTMQF